MDVNGKINPVSGTAPTPATELPDEQSSARRFECQKMKNFALYQLIDEDSETSGEDCFTAGDSLQSSAATAVSSESCGKETDNKDGEHHSAFTPTHNEPINSKQGIFSVSQGGFSSTAQDGGGSPTDNSGHMSSQPSAIMSLTSVWSPGHEYKRSFWPPRVPGTTVSPTSEGKQDEVGSQSSGTAAGSNAAEEIEMGAIPGTSQCSGSNVPPTKVSLGDGKKAVKSGDCPKPSVNSDGVDKLANIVAVKVKFLPPEFTEKHKSKVRDIASTINKMSSSTPCLSPVSKEANPDKEARVVQKATSSPVLPIIKITEAEDVEEETLLSESTDPAECASNAGVSAVERSTGVVSEIEATRKPESTESIERSAETVKGIWESFNPESSDPIGSNPAKIGEILQGKDYIPAVESPSNDEPEECFEEETAIASDSPSSPRENQEFGDATSEDGRQAFYTSFADMAPEFRYRTPCTSSEASSIRNRSEGPRCLGSRTLHGGIVVCCIVIAMVGLAVYQLAHDGKLAEVYETVGLAFSVIAFVAGIFSCLYISAELCFPNILSFHHQRMADVETATSLDRIPYPERHNVEHIPLQTLTGFRARSPSTLPSTEVIPEDRQSNTSSLLDDTHQLQTEVTGLLQTLANAMSKQSLEQADEEPFTIYETEDTGFCESGPSEQPSNYTVEIPPSGHNSSSESDARSTPSKKDD